MGELGIGQSVTRFEDPRLLRGRGNCITTSIFPVRSTRTSAPWTRRRPLPPRRVRLDSRREVDGHGPRNVRKGSKLVRKLLGR